MFVFRLELILIISSTWSFTGVLSIVGNNSHGETCSNESPCKSPLLCSKTNQCHCSKLSSHWEEATQDCLYCSTGSVEWKRQSCLLLVIPSNSIPFTFIEGKQACQSQSGDVFRFNQRTEFDQFTNLIKLLLETPNAKNILLYLRFGSWIQLDFAVSKSDGLFCNITDKLQNSSCVSLHMKDSGNLCFQPNDCQKRLLTVCNTPIKSETYGTINGSATDEGQERFIELLSALAPAAFNLIGDLFGGNKKPDPPPPTPAPQPIIIQQPSMPSLPSAQADSSKGSSLYIILIVVGILVLLILVGACVAIFLCTRKSSGATVVEVQRASYESN